MKVGGRIVSVLLELLIPGAGSYAKGHRSRSAFVFGATVLAFAAGAGGRTAPSTRELVLLLVAAGAGLVAGSTLEHRRVEAACRGTNVCDLFEEGAGRRRYQVALSRDAMAPASGSFAIPIGNVFVLGDNRHESSDSRNFGPVPFENLVGRYVFTWWSK